MRRYIDPTIKIARFQNESVGALEIISYIPPVQEYIDANSESIHERMESFRELLQFR